MSPRPAEPEPSLRPGHPPPPTAPAERRELRRPPRSACRGFGLVEMLAALGVIGVVSAWGLPTWNGFLERRRVEALSNQLLTDLQGLRQLALAQGESVRLTLPTTALAGSGYLIHTGAAGACSCAAGAARCSAPARPLRDRCPTPPDPGVTLRSNVGSILVDPRQTTFSPTGSIEVSAPRAGTLRHVVNIMGRTRLCSPSGRFSGVPVC